MNHPDYYAAYVAAKARNHRPQWSWGRLKMLCRCGSELPCSRLTEMPKFHYWSA